MAGGLKIYGIPNCDTVKKAINWLSENKLSYTFHNYKTEGITAAKLTAWSKAKSWKVLLNKKSTTWKKLAPPLPDEELTQAQAIKLMQENTSMIKRPVLELNGAIVVGFNEEEYKQLLNK